MNQKIIMNEISIIKKTMLLIILFLLIGCSSKHLRFRSDKYMDNEIARVSECRKSWNYEVFEGYIELKKLDFIKSTYVTFRGFPNFFIGENIDGDTIGMIVYDENPELDRGETIHAIAAKSKIIKFVPDKPKAIKNNINFTIEESLLDRPVFTVSYKKKINDLQCAVSKVYYGKISEWR